MRHARSRRLLAALAAASAAVPASAALTVAAVSTAPAAAAAEWSPPAIARQLGGPSSAQVYAWGVDTNPVTGELLVGDYVNKTVRRYSATGAYLGHTDGPTNVGLYAGIAADPRDGSFYVGTQQGGSGIVLKFDKTGHFLYSFDPPGLSPYLTVDADGYVYANQRTDGFRIDKWRLDDATHSYEVVKQFSAPGGQWYNDVAVTSDGRVFAVQQDQYRVRVFDASGAVAGQIGSKGLGNGRFNGDMRGLAVDEAADRVYVVDAADNAVEVFTLAGSYVATWGGVGSGPGQFQDGGRQIAAGADGTVYVADYGNMRVVPFSRSGTALAPVPTPSADPDTWGFNSLMDVAYDPTTGDVLGVDSYNQRFQRFAADGTLVDVRGRRGNDPPYGMNYPKGITVDPATGEVWIVHDELGRPDITVYDTDGTFVRGVTEPTRRRAAAIYDGEAYIVASGSVNVRSVATGAQVRQWGASGRNLGIDPADGTVYVPNGNAVAVFSKTGTRLGTLTGGTSLYDAAVLGGVVYVTDSAGNRILAFDKVTRELLGSFGTKGTKAGQLNLPQGIDSDGVDTLYVADRGNARIDVFSVSQPVPADSTAPTVTVSSPRAGATLPAGPALLTGTAADAGSGVASVEVSIKDTSTGHWWDAKSSLWLTRQVWNGAAVSGPRAASQWRFAVTGAEWQHGYAVTVRSRDRAGVQSTKAATTSFTIGDDSPPDTTITAPSAGTRPAGTVAIAGSASDNRALASVQVSVRDATAGTWWDPAAAAWAASQVWFPATLASPGSATSGWTSSVPATAFGHQFAVSARAVDVAGRTDASPAGVSFTTSAADSTPPDTAVSGVARPGAAGTAVTIRGSATDNLGVAAVKVAVQNTGTGKWLGTSGTFGTAKTQLAATLDGAGTASATWSFSAPLGNGSYLVEATAADAGGGTDATPASLRFVVLAAGADAQTPDAAITEPTAGSAVVAPPVIRGTATDDLGVASVRLTIRDQASGKYFDGTGFGSTATELPADLEAPGTRETAWSLATTLPPGRYTVTAKAVDVANRVDPTRPSVSFQAITGTGRISVDRWDGVTGGTLASIPAGTAATSTGDVAAPDGLLYQPDADSYGARLRVLLRPETTGNYTFWLAADDQATLRVGPATGDVTATPTIARVDSAVGLGQWKQFPQQQSAPVKLLAGTDYYLEVAVVEGAGGDFAEVAWQRDGTLTPQLVPAARFRPAGSLGASGGWRAQVEVLGGVASQSSTNFGGDPARARDGNTDGSWGSGSVTHTDFQDRPYWDLDLGSNAPVTLVELWNRTDCCSERLSDVHVFASDTPFETDDPEALAATPGVQHVLVAGQLPVTRQVRFDGRPVRYLRVQLSGSTALSLAEVRVIAG